MDQRCFRLLAYRTFCDLAAAYHFGPATGQDHNAHMLAQVCASAHERPGQSATCRLAKAAVRQGAGRKVVQYQTCCHGGHADAIVSPYSAFPVLCSIGIQAPPDCSQTQPYTRVCQQKDRVLPSGQRFNTYTSRKQTRGIRGESQSTAPTRPPSCPLVLAPT